MASETRDLRRLTFNLMSLIATPIALYYAASWLFDRLDPLKQRNDAAKKQSAKAIQRLQKSVKDANLRLKDITEHETVIMSEVITPEELNVKFEGFQTNLSVCVDNIDIGGLEEIISSVKETVIYPLVYPDLFRSASYCPLLPKRTNIKRSIECATGSITLWSTRVWKDYARQSYGCGIVSIPVL
jgi:ATPase family AAA domain-containing protein 1